MSTPAAAGPWTLDAFLAWEREQAERHEFIGGRIYAMTGARIGHGRTVNALAEALRRQLPGGCEVFTEAYRLVAAADSNYPDLMVVCSNPDDDETELHDADLLVEVVSPSNRPGVMLEKRDAYLTLPSLVAYLVVDGDQYEVWTRVEAGPWQCKTVKAGEFSVMVQGHEVKP